MQQTTASLLPLEREIKGSPHSYDFCETSVTWESGLIHTIYHEEIEIFSESQNVKYAYIFNSELPSLGGYLVGDKSLEPTSENQK